MFDLEPAIIEWRTRMIRGGIKTPAVLDELESHLREEVQNQLRSGAAAEQAYALAVERLGVAGSLKQEFEKLSRERKRNWLRRGSIVGGTLFAYTGVFATWILARRTGRIKITGTELLLLLGSMLATMLFGFLGRRVGNRLPMILNEQRQAAFVIVAVFAAGASLRLLWNWLPFDDLVQAQVILLWTMSPVLGVGHCFSAWSQRCYAARARVKV
jgi:hypothetical protein